MRTRWPISPFIWLPGCRSKEFQNKYFHTAQTYETANRELMVNSWNYTRAWTLVEKITLGGKRLTAKLSLLQNGVNGARQLCHDAILSFIQNSKSQFCGIVKYICTWWDNNCGMENQSQNVLKTLAPLMSVFFFLPLLSLTDRQNRRQFGGTLNNVQIFWSATLKRFCF